MKLARQPNLLHLFILMSTHVYTEAIGVKWPKGGVPVTFVSVLTCGLKHYCNPEISLLTMQRSCLSGGIRNDAGADG